MTFGRITKIAGTLAAALMVSAPLALAPAASFAATTQHDSHYANSAGGKQVAMYGKFRDGKAHRYADRMHRPAPRFEKIAFEKHPGFMFFAGHWTWQVNHWHWNAGSWQHR